MESHLTAVVITVTSKIIYSTFRFRSSMTSISIPVTGTVPTVMWKVGDLQHLCSVKCSDDYVNIFNYLVLLSELLSCLVILNHSTATL